MFRSRRFLIPVLGVVALLFVGCELESGASTKLDECNRLLRAFCNRGDALDCGTAAEIAECKSEMKAACAEGFDGTCEATDEDLDLVDHDIKNIINPKETCDGLLSITGYLESTLQTIQANPCR